MKIGNAVSFDTILNTIIAEGVDQEIDAFNGATGNAIVLRGTTGQGSFEYEKMIKDISDAAQYRRDIASGAAATPADYSEEESIKVSVAGGFLVNVPSAVLAWAGQGEPSAAVSQALAELAKQYAQAIVKDQLNTALAAAVGAGTANADVYNDDKLNAITLDGVSDTLGLLNDAQSKLKCLFMPAKAFNKLRKDALTNTARLFEIDGVTIYSADYLGLGVKVLVTDSPAFDITTTLAVIAVVEMGIVVTDFKDRTVVDTITGNQNITDSFQGNYKFTLGLKGYSWDVTNGGISPSDAALATGANWDVIATSYKNTGFVVGEFLA